MAYLTLLDGYLTTLKPYWLKMITVEAIAILELKCILFPVEDILLELGVSKTEQEIIRLE
jgi:hypothetical protein